MSSQEQRVCAIYVGINAHPPQESRSDGALAAFSANGLRWSCAWSPILFVISWAESLPVAGKWRVSGLLTSGFPLCFLQIMYYMWFYRTVTSSKHQDRLSTAYETDGSRVSTSFQFEAVVLVSKLLTLFSSEVKMEHEMEHQQCFRHCTRLLHWMSKTMRLHVQVAEMMFLHRVSSLTVRDWEETRGRPRVFWRDYISHLAWALQDHPGGAGGRS